MCERLSGATSPALDRLDQAVVLASRPSTAIGPGRSNDSSESSQRLPGRVGVTGEPLTHLDERGLQESPDVCGRGPAEWTDHRSGSPARRVTTGR
jgi:hypothetical protein